MNQKIIEIYPRKIIYWINIDKIYFDYILVYNLHKYREM